MPEGALTYIPYMTHRYFAGQAYLLTSKSRSCREYLRQTYNIIVVDHFSNLTKKYMSLADFNTI